MKASNASQEMKTYVNNKVYCGKEILVKDFLDFNLSDLNIGHCKCCDVYAKNCKCFVYVSLSFYIPC